MTEADEVKARIMELVYSARPVVANGSAAVEDAYHAIDFLKGAADRLKGSRVHAQQELAGLKGLIDQATSLVASSPNNFELMLAQSNLEQARLQVENYASRVTFSIDKLNALIAVVQHRVDTEINESGTLVRMAMESYSEYINKI
jgi:hypothetical protein